MQTGICLTGKRTQKQVGIAVYPSLPLLLGKRKGEETSRDAARYTATQLQEGEANTRKVFALGPQLVITGDIPEGVSAVAKKIQIDEEVFEKIKETEGNADISLVCAYDIKLFDAEGNEWQPEGKVEVSIADEAPVTPKKNFL